MKEKRCVVVGAGPVDRLPAPLPGDLVIAADGGYSALSRAGIRPDVVIGDFDSLPARPDHPGVVPLPREKDDTDMLAALRLGLARGYGEFHVYGGFGGRFDHTLANVQCLAFLARNGARGFLYGGGNVITCVQDGSMEFDAAHRGVLSVFSHSDVSKGVYLEGLKFPLADATLTSDFPLGCSNEFTGVASRVSVREGTLVVVWAGET